MRDPLPKSELADLFDPLALARQHEDDNRPEVQIVTRDMIYHHVWIPNADYCELPVAGQCPSLLVVCRAELVRRGHRLGRHDHQR